MYVDGKHTRFLQKEEKFILFTLAEICYTKSPTQEEEDLIVRFLTKVLEKNLDVWFSPDIPETSKSVDNPRQRGEPWQEDVIPASSNMKRFS